MSFVPTIVNIINQKYKNLRAYIARIAMDIGLIKNQSITQQFYELIRQNNIPKPVFSWFGEAATKPRVSGIYSYATKLYSLFTPTAKYGPELVVNGAFDSDTNWGKGTGWTISNGKAVANSATGTLSNTSVNVSIGKLYKISCEVSNYITGSLNVQVGGTGADILISNKNGSYSVNYTASSTGALYFTPKLNFTGSVDNVSVIEVLNSLDGSPTDATQATSTSQPYLSGNIAPNEKLCLKNVNGDSRYMTHPTISFGANEAWSVSTVVNYSGSNADASAYCGSNNNSRIDLRLQNKIGIQTESGPIVYSSLSTNTLIGKFKTITIVCYGNSTVDIYIDGAYKESLSHPTDFSFQTITRGKANWYYNGTISAHIITPAALTPSQVAITSNFLRQQYPEIPTVKIGNDYWATSNCEMVATPQGNLMANVTANANVEKLTNGGFDTDTNWSKGLDWTISGGAANCTGSEVSSRIIHNSASGINGVWYKCTYTISAYTSGVVNVGIGTSHALTTSGLGTYTKYIQAPSNSSSMFIRAYYFIGSIDNFSIQEIGWSGSTELYDGIYAQTAGTVEQKTYAAVKAAAMWCFYNNDMAIGSVYGKLYNWYAVKFLQMDIDYYNAANPTTPWGYKVPTDTDFNNMATALGGASVAGGKMKKEGTVYFTSPNTGADNSSGFSGLGGGRRRNDTGLSAAFSNNGYFWNSSSGYFYLAHTSEELVIASSTDNRIGFSLRLLKS